MSSIHSTQLHKEKDSFEQSRSESVMITPPDLERPTLDRRDSLASLSVAAYPSSSMKEPTWPTGWRPYACLFGGFLLMFNSWGLVWLYIRYHSFHQAIDIYR